MIAASNAANRALEESALDELETTGAITLIGLTIA